MNMKHTDKTEFLCLRGNRITQVISRLEERLKIWICVTFSNSKSSGHSDGINVKLVQLLCKIESLLCGLSTSVEVHLYRGLFVIPMKKHIRDVCLVCMWTVPHRRAGEHTTVCVRLQELCPVLPVRREELILHSYTINVYLSIHFTLRKCLLKIYEDFP